MEEAVRICVLVQERGLDWRFKFRSHDSTIKVGLNEAIKERRYKE